MHDQLVISPVGASAQYSVLGRGVDSDDPIRGAGTQRESDAVLIDGCGRRIDHLRLSVTSACNLRCLYCRPKGIGDATSHGRDLDDKQRLELVHFLYESYHLRQLRLTGGEPLLHPSITSLIADVRRIAPDMDLAMTTNGGRLADLAGPLRCAGLDRVNISLDTLDPVQYHNLTGGELAPVLDGIKKCIAVGFPSPRINTVVLAGINDQHLIELTEWSLQQGTEIRFLEAMPIGPAANYNRDRFVDAATIRKALARRIMLTPLPRNHGETAMRYLAVRGTSRGIVGIIAPVTERFCGQCRRMRITADGRLFPCLLDERSVELLPAWGQGRLSPASLDRLIQSAVDAKKWQGPALQRTAMVQLGG
ncbi:MAG: radical SAM protein [Planctomycetota bacterium]